MLGDITSPSSHHVSPHDGMMPQRSKSPYAPAINNKTRHIVHRKHINCGTGQYDEDFGYSLQYKEQYGK
jgi:hypothetical protein